MLLFLRFFIVLLLPFFSFTSAFAEDEVAFIRKAYQTLSGIEFVQPDTRAQAMAEIRGFFDFESFCHLAIQDIEPKMIPEEVKKFRDLFDRVFFKNIEKKGLKMADKRIQNIQYSVESRQNQVSVALIQGRVDQKNVTIKFHLKKNNSSWGIVDIYVNSAGASRNYRGQFNRIYRVEGFEGLMTRMEKKLTAFSK